MKRAFGPYVVEQELARGGMGVVYAVRHRETGARYALKTLRAVGLGDQKELQRFQREADLMSRLDHPGIVRVHTAGSEDGVAYLVQSFLPGGSLQDRLRERGRLPREEAVALVAALADAVEYAHQHQVVHRDLKPHNVLFDEAGRAVLVDFGLGRDLAAESRRLTETGQVMGTPGYMAPEQVQGERRDDPRTDVYGLGAILFALLTGKPPFAGRGLGVLAKIVHDSAPDLAVLDPDTPPALAATVARCLAKRPGDRFPSAGDLARVLRSGDAPTTPDASLAPALIGLGALAGGALTILALASGPSPSSAPLDDRPVDPTSSVPRPAPRPTVDWDEAVRRVRRSPREALRLIPRGASLEGSDALLRQLDWAAGELAEQMARLKRTERVDAKHLQRWVDYLAVSLRLRPGQVPEAWLPGLRRAIQNAAPGSGRSLLSLLELLGLRTAPVNLLKDVLGFVKTHNQSDFRWRLLRECQRLLPPTRTSGDWLDAQRKLIRELVRRLGVAKAQHAVQEERAATLLKRCEQLAQVDRDNQQLIRIRARVLLVLGRNREAGEVAMRGASLGDPPCIGLRSLAAGRQGDPRAAPLARQYLDKAPWTEAGNTLYASVVASMWERRDPFIRKEIRRMLRRATQRKQRRRDDLHGWRLRGAYMDLAAGALVSAQAGIQKAQEEVRGVAPGCPCAELHRRILALPRLSDAAAQLKQLVDDLDALRRKGRSGLP